MNKIAIWLALGLALAGCSHGPALAPRPGITALTREAMPPPTRQDLTSPGRPYVIGPFDRLSIEVMGLAELSRQVQADAGGRLSVPYAGTIDAAGMTPQELGEAIAARLVRVIKDPQVTVNVIDTVSNLVTVDGQVTEPGLYPVLGRMTLMRAVASAKGLSEFAKDQEVVVFRKVDGDDYVALYDLRAIRRGAYADPEIYANDIVFVGDSPQKRLIRNIIQAAPILTAPLVAILQNN